MKLKILIFVALAVLFIGASCQKTTPKGATKPKSDYTSTKKGTATTKKPQVGTKKATKTKSGQTTPSGPKLKAGAATPPVFTPPPTPPVFTCDNITGLATFNFANFATGKWFVLREMCAFPFNPWFGTCAMGTFTLDAAKTTSTLVVNTFIEGAYANSQTSTLTGGTNGIMTWTVNNVQVRTDIMPSTSTMKFVVVDTDYTNWAAVYSCGNLCVQVPSNKPASAATACSPGAITGYYILLRSRTLAKDVEDSYVKLATDALNVKWPYMLFMPHEQSPLVCTNT